MSNPNKPFFSEPVLSAAERTQQRVSSSRAGRALVSIATGSPSPAYEQLEYRTPAPEDVTIFQVAVAPGNVYAGKWVRKWLNAAVFGVAYDEVNEKIDDHIGSNPQEAVAYLSSGTWHVGVMSRTDQVLYEPIPHENRILAVASRVGKNDLSLTMGLWLPEDQAFVGFDSVRLVNESLQIGHLPDVYPGVRLV